MKDIWNEDPAKWNKLPLWEKVEIMRAWHCTGPVGQGGKILGTRDALGETLRSVRGELIKAEDFRSQVVAAVIECHEFDELYSRLMQLLD